MNSVTVIRNKLAEHFPGYVFSVSRKGKVVRALICGPGHLALRFADMPKFADAFGTENLNFGKTEDEPGVCYSSWTYEDGTPGDLFVEGWE